jgi:hypothetical protein
VAQSPRVAGQSIEGIDAMVNCEFAKGISSLGNLLGQKVDDGLRSADNAYSDLKKNIQQHAAAIFVLVVSLAASTNLEASDIARMRQDLNNFSHECLVCNAFYSTVGLCLAKSQEDPELTNRYQSGANLFWRLAVDTGRIAEVSDQAIAARFELVMAGLMKDIDESCTNIAVILLKYGEKCKSLLEAGPSQLDEIARRAQ